MQNQNKEKAICMDIQNKEKSTVSAIKKSDTTKKCPIFPGGLK
jgi:hypothetical protein